MVLSILIRYPRQSPERNKKFFEKKNQELTNLDWAKWGGWYDTDGWFSIWSPVSKYKCEKAVGLSLTDRQPVELFSKTFETSLRTQIKTTITPEPYRKEYTVQVYRAELFAEKAEWFTQKVFPYLVKHEKKDYAAKLLENPPESKDFAEWTPEEVRNYLATVVEGDGTIQCRSAKKTKNVVLRIKSSDPQYLSDLRHLTKDKLGVISTFREEMTYETQEGTKTKYELYIHCSRKNSHNLDFVQSLVQQGVMTLDRKKQRIQEFINQ